MIRIQTSDFSLEQEVIALTAHNNRIGGIVTFVGTVRDYADSGSVTAIELEHYPGMTEAELTKIEAAARARFEVEELAVIHRVGRLDAGENIVLVIAAARHRAAAFDACRFLIDHLKLYATIWKKEFTADGARWVDSCPGCQAALGPESAVTQHRDHAHDHPHDHPHDHAHGMSGHTHDHAHGAAGHDHAHGPGSGGAASGYSWAGLRVGILTLSDTRSLSEDGSGDVLEGLSLAAGATVVKRAILRDERAAIAAILREWADSGGVDFILTTGGTGPGPRDVTPEATREVCDRELPGMAELIRRAGLEQVRSAVLTRGVVALRGTTVVVNLPGSKRGAAHSLTAVADLLPHIRNMALGEKH